MPNRILRSLASMLGYISLSFPPCDDMKNMSVNTREIKDNNFRSEERSTSVVENDAITNDRFRVRMELRKEKKTVFSLP